MTKRRLSLQQKRRIAEQRQHKRETAALKDLPDDSELGEQQQGIVITNYGTQVEVESVDDGEKRLRQRCHIRANLHLVSGDRVRWRAGRELGVIESCETRSSELQRPDIYGKLRTVAANITQMLITLAPEPEPFANLIDRYLIAAKLHKLDVILLANKIDTLDECNREAFEDIVTTYTKLGYPVLSISAKTGAGDQALKAALNHHISIFVGQSGVGKSSIIHYLLPDKDIRIGELSDTKKKGRHTTTHSELYHFPFGGHCVDSPGIREFGLWHATPGQVLAGFHEIASAAERCKFRDCAHNNEPNCAVTEAINKGDISSTRFENYRLIIAQLSESTIQIH